MNPMGEHAPCRIGRADACSAFVQSPMYLNLETLMLISLDIFSKYLFQMGGGDNDHEWPLMAISVSPKENPTEINGHNFSTLLELGKH